MIEQKLATLKAFRQGFAHRLLDDAGTGKTDQRAGFADVYIAQHRKTCGNAARGRVGQDRDIRNSPGTKISQCCRALLVYFLSALIIAIGFVVIIYFNYLSEEKTINAWSPTMCQTDYVYTKDAAIEDLANEDFDQ